MAETWNETVEEHNQRMAEFDESERAYYNSLNEENATDMFDDDYYNESMDELHRLHGIIPRRLEPIFQDQYQMTEDEWDDLWSPPQKKEKSNPKIGDIMTVTLIVNDETESIMKTEEFDCPICYTSVCKWDAVHLNCAHVFCGACVTSHLDTLHKNHALLPSCALCRNEYTFFEIPNPEICNKIELMLRK
jgi:hypothetical protein